MGGAGRRTRALLGAVLLSIAGMLPVTLVGALAVQVRADIGIGRTWIGVLVSLFFTAGAVSASRIGAASDRVGWRRASIVGGMASMVSLVAVGTVVRGPWLAAVALAVGGVAMTASVATTNLVLAVEMPGNRLGFLLGLKQSSVPLSGLAAGLAVPLVALRLGWRWAFVAAAVVPLAAVWMAALTPHHPAGTDAPAGRGTGAGTVGGERPALARPRFRAGRRLRVLTVGMGFASVVPGVLTGFLVLTAVEAGLDEASAGTLLAVCSIAGIAVRIGYGWVIDRVRSDAVAHVAALLAGGAVGAAMLATGRTALVVPGAVIAFACGWGWPGLFFYELIRDHPRDSAAATGFSQTGALVGSALGPLAFGAVADLVGTSVAWAGTAVLAAVAAAVMAWATRLPRPESAPGLHHARGATG